MKLKIKVLVGPICSGKTTYAKKFLKKNDNYICINKDVLRLMLQNKDRLSIDLENILHKEMNEFILSFLFAGYNILIDSCNCRIKDHQDIITCFSDVAEIEFIYMPNTSLEVLYNRNKKRANENYKEPIPGFIVRNSYTSFLELKKNEKHNS